jgi:hypothetical protein
MRRNIMKAKARTSPYPSKKKASDRSEDDSARQTPAPAQIESSSPLAEGRPVARFSPLRGLLGVYADPRTWGAAFYILVSLVTGSFYFTWAVTGLALSISFLILIVGIPFATLFLVSVRGLSSLEVRLVQVSLQSPITPRPILGQAGSKWFERLKAMLSDAGTWSALLYMVLQLPLGVIYFSIAVSLAALALGLMSAPFLYVLVAPTPVMRIPGGQFQIPLWGLLLIEIGGFLTLTAAMHVIRGIGRWHARYAQALLGG